MKEDGKQVPIVAFQPINIAPPPPPPVAWMRDVTPDVTTNSLDGSRLIVIVVDDALTPSEPRMIRDAKKAFTDVVAELTPSDYTAVVFTGDGRKAQDFTYDRAALLKCADRFGLGMATWRFGLDNGGHLNLDLPYYVASVTTLEQVAESLMALPERRKVLIWLTPGIPVDPVGAAPKAAPVLTGATRGGAKGGGSAGADPLSDADSLIDHEALLTLRARTVALFERAQRAHVVICPIDVSGLGGLENLMWQTYLNAGIDGPSAQRLSHLQASQALDFVMTAAANTGGHAIVNTNDFSEGVKQIFVENASYYLLGFRSADARQDRSIHRVQVEVDRPDVEIRTRNIYESAPQDDPKAKAKLSPESAALVNAIAGAVPKTELPMSVTVAPFAVLGVRTATVAITYEVRQPLSVGGRESATTEKTELQVAAFTPDGQLRDMQRRTATLKIRPGAVSDAEYEVLAQVALPPGRYRLRLAAHSVSSGKTGSVATDLLIPDYGNEPFSMSGVIINSSAPRPSAPKNLFASLLPFVPTAERSFSATENVTAFLRLYQSGRKGIGPASVTIMVSDSTGQPPLRESLTIPVGEFSGRAASPNSTDRYAPKTRDQVESRGANKPEDPFASAGLRQANVTYVVPVNKLVSGPHLLTFEATIGAITLRRDVRFQVR